MNLLKYIKWSNTWIIIRLPKKLFHKAAEYLCIKSITDKSFHVDRLFFVIIYLFVSFGDWEERNIWLVYCDVAVTQAHTGKVKQISLTVSVPMLLFQTDLFVNESFDCEVFGSPRSAFTRWPGKHSKCILQTLNSHDNDEVKYCWEWQLI